MSLASSVDGIEFHRELLIATFLASSARAVPTLRTSYSIIERAPGHARWVHAVA